MRRASTTLSCLSAGYGGLQALAAGTLTSAAPTVTDAGLHACGSSFPVAVLLCWPSTRHAGLRAIDNEGDYKHLKIQGERVDAVVHEDVALMKMDVEGFEPHVLEGAKGLFELRLVDNVSAALPNTPA